MNRVFRMGSLEEKKLMTMWMILRDKFEAGSKKEATDLQLREGDIIDSGKCLPCLLFISWLL